MSARRHRSDAEYIHQVASECSACICQILGDEFDVRGALDPDDDLARDLGLDEKALRCFFVGLEDRFGIVLPRAGVIRTVSDLARAVAWGALARSA